MVKEKPQILLIHGGMTFKNQKDYLNYLHNRPISVEKKLRWQLDYLDKKLGKKFEIIRPKMPLQDNAKYEDWKIHLERHFPLLRENIVLIGNSLGSIFLAKYLSEHKFPKNILSTYLVCPPFDNTIKGEDLVGGFVLKDNISLIEENSSNTTLMFSKTDEVVPVLHAKKYKKKLKNSNILIYEDKNGHFKISKFPEIVKMIKLDMKRI
ncbi:MAG: alpha/beta hydrolase [Candidatus Woesearchaeota archaeon]|jgi:predicted alpha/beta hydrolase family esterase|nr:alpha/beta hydrolase [Candidatus Woesearchaeota archaeon]